MENLLPNDILTRVTRYNLIREQRLVYIDVHERLQGQLAGRFVAVPNLVNIVARPEYQGVGETESEALERCLARVRDAKVEDLFPRKSE
ncbi:MAG TPA: hypothetical protein VLH81_04045 [Desulfobacterales bacterium]|nr:hypothetical protein [Desulfobacterales bacterium]